MGNRRIGRKRLYGVEKQGQSIDLDSGAGISGAIIRATQHRQGQELITEILLILIRCRTNLKVVGKQGLKSKRHIARLNC